MSDTTPWHARVPSAESQRETKNVDKDFQRETLMATASLVSRPESMAL